MIGAKENLKDNMTIIFDGKKFAREKEAVLAEKVKDLKAKGITPKLAVISCQDDEATELFLKLKAAAAERIGVEFELFRFARAKHNKRDLIMNMTRELSRMPGTYGFMLQLPLTPQLQRYTDYLINLIDPPRDVDGLRPDSIFDSAVVKAVIDIVYAAKKELNIDDLSKLTYLVVGSEGRVGKAMVKKLQSLGYNVFGEDGFFIGRNTSVNIKTSADVVISCTGIPNLIKGTHVKDNAIVIDVGSPKGDVLFDVVAKRAAFITPVPGGVGPVTIACLFENLVEAVYNSQSQTHAEAISS